jgi:transposase-like protein
VEFKWRQFEPQFILMAAGWTCAFPLSYRDVEELSARRDAASAKRLFQKALCASCHPTPRIINVDRNPSYRSVVEALKSEGTL